MKVNIFNRGLVISIILLLTFSCTNYNKIRKVNFRKSTKVEHSEEVQETKQEESKEFAPIDYENKTSDKVDNTFVSDSIEINGEGSDILIEASPNEKSNLNGTEEFVPPNETLTYKHRAFDANRTGKRYGLYVLLGIALVVGWFLLFSLPFIWGLALVIVASISGITAAVREQKSNKRISTAIIVLLALCILVSLLLVLVVISTESILFAFILFVLMLIVVATTITFYVLTLVNFIRSAAFSLEHKLRREDGDTSGDKLQILNGLLMVFASLFLLFIPLIFVVLAKRKVRKKYK